jgi:DNA-binding ferritin-like protein
MRKSQVQMYNELHNRMIELDKDLSDKMEVLRERALYMYYKSNKFQNEENVRSYIYKLRTGYSLVNKDIEDIYNILAYLTQELKEFNKKYDHALDDAEFYNEHARNQYES